MANSRNEDLLENILGGSNEYGEPQSRNEAILQNILGEHNDLQEPTSRIEELLLEILEQGTGGENIGYQVTFIVDGEPYYIASCLQGESITAPPTPTGSFASWQLNGVDITFPYTPNADVELVATYSQIHTEIEVENAGEQLYSYSGGTITKTSAGTAIYGYCIYNTTQKFLFLISQTANNTAMSGNVSQYGNKISFTYNGETWYFSHSNATETTGVLHEAADVGDYNQYGNAPLIAKAILDYYFDV